MDRLPLRRLLPYLLGGLVVLAVGGWSLRSMDGQAVSGEEVSVTRGASEGSGDGDAGASAADAPGSVAASTSLAPEPAAPGKVFVQVAGAVRRPGVYEVPAGARVFEVLLRAGGATEDGDDQALPLAAVVADGMRLVVPAKGQAGVGDDTVVPGANGAGVEAGSSGGLVQGLSRAGPDAPVSLNSATASELEALPGIGPKTAERIVAYRESNGPFATVEDLDDVPGIGPATVERLRGLVLP